MSVLVTLAHPRTGPRDPAARLLAGLALDLAAREAGWGSAVRFDAGRRVLVPLAGPPGVQAWVSGWLPGQSSDLHDHGSTAAAMVVVRGALVERAVDEHGRPVVLELRTGVVATLAAGIRHVVANEGASPAVSIHVRTTAAATT